MKKRRVFLIGAPKCGTSSLANWLGRHTQVQLAIDKEPGFFRTGERRWVMDAHHPERIEIRSSRDAMSDPEEYERQFCDAGLKTWRLDASTDYFADSGSCKRIKEISEADDVKVFCILRDPVERMYSEYRHSLRENAEVLSFRDSLDAEHERIANNYQPLFFHKCRSEYWTHLNRWRGAFEDKDFLMLSYSEIGETSVLENKVCDFLDIPVEHIGSMAKLNASASTPKNKSPLQSAKKFIKTTLGIQGSKPSVTYPAFTLEDQRYAFSSIKDQVELCMADPKVPTNDWALCAKLFAELSPSV